MRARALVRGLALAGTAVAVAAATSAGRGRDLDRKSFELLRRRGAVADALALGATDLGSIWASVGAAALLGAAGERRAAGKALSAAGAAWLLGQGMKRAFLRPRPYVADPEGVRPLIDFPWATSWPSSHPMVLLAFLSVAGRELGVGRLGRAALSALAGGVGVTRTYVGVHYPSDVVGGLLLGRAVGSVMSGTGL